MYIINTIPHGKCFVRYLRTRCFCIRNLTRSLRSLVRFLIRQQLVRKYRTPALSMKYSLYMSLFSVDFIWRYGPKTRLSLKAQTLANQLPVFRRENCARNAPTKLTILKKFLRSQNGRRCKKMQKDFVQVRNVFQLSTQRMWVNIVSRSSYKAKKR